MRCAVYIDENKDLISQNVKAWGELQSLNEEPCYREEDIKSAVDKAEFAGYKMALDDVIASAEDLTDLADAAAYGCLSSGLKRFVEDIKDRCYGNLCMLLFSIIDNQDSDPDS
ncbi:MAG: hypothetical protein HUJ54_12375 [Erysipelotrichaceae bacterium]|nr:hypothetical protein [Erysipelotrichaceae bacterium]